MFSADIQSANVSALIKKSSRYTTVALKLHSLQLLIFFEIFSFLFNTFVKVELSYVFTINLFTIAETAGKSELSYKTGVFFSCW